jgi:hypothetical protein
MENVATEEFISRTEALKDFESCNAENPNWTPQRVKTLLLRQPAADVAEVVRCKDCKHKVRTDANGIVICSEEHGMYCPTESDSCSYGEYQTNTGGVTE